MNSSIKPQLAYITHDRVVPASRWKEQAPQRKSVMLVPRADGKGLEKKEVWLPDLKAPQPPKPLLVEIRTSRVLSVDKAGNLVVATHKASRNQGFLAIRPVWVEHEGGQRLIGLLDARTDSLAFEVAGK